MRTEPSSSTDNDLQIALRIVPQDVWKPFRRVFEHTGPISSNPILADTALFAWFCWEWSVARTVRAGMQDDLRVRLRDSPEFAAALGDDAGQMLAQLEQSLRSEFGARGGNSIISLLSKVAAFLRPERFVAWDTYARQGTNLILGRSKYCAFSDYARYLSDFDRIWRGQSGERIRILTSNDPLEPAELTPAFQRRVLDLYLMRVGGAPDWGFGKGQGSDCAAF
jgi:hypothetical protein